MSIAEYPLRRRRFRAAPSLSREARQRLRWIEFYMAHGRQLRLTCRHFGISTATFYLWWRRYDPWRLESLEDDRHTRRPKRVRQPHTPPALVARIRAVREQFSPVGQGEARRAPASRRLAGVGVDRWSDPDPPAGHRAARGTALRASRPREIDGGSEFKAAFETACQELGIRLYVLPPHSPRLNGHVERAHRTHQEEFYDLQEIPEALGAHNTLLRDWEDIYNSVRPHQAPGLPDPERVPRALAGHTPMKKEARVVVSNWTSTPP